MNLKKIKVADKNRIFAIKIVKSFHQKQPTFVQGLVYDNGKIYTSSGGFFGHSFIRQSNLNTGQIIRQRPIEKSLFAEGITIFHNKLYQSFFGTSNMEQYIIKAR